MRLGEFFYLPNLVTLFRMFAVFPVAYLISNQHDTATFWLVFVAGLTDSVDGWIAKRFNMQSELGVALDPLADKVLLFGCYALMAVYDYIPMWLFIVVISRDAIIVTGASIYHHIIEPVKAMPLPSGKLTTFFQILFVLLIFGDIAFVVDLKQIINVMIIVVAALTVISGIQYMWVWGEKAWKKNNISQS